ncbi:MutS-related protein [Dyadobacter aurulentus]|uniref:MutS-related protein n=1 Tax=Dyadobacter sp. UC 10 TaxID=2605428 RepID=UPI0011F0EEA7|nr:DNA mismatch repair protein MutS [Dyadobacter sp. UC 10]KAA0992648.1 DNA mismatch repair protein MutS [Dyadobacter sp. UC 10]
MTEIYSERAQQYSSKIGEYEKELRRLSTIRLFIFIGSLILVFVLANEQLATLLLAVVPISLLAFGFVLNRYKLTARALSRFKFLRAVNEQEISRLDNKLAEFPTGQRFLVRDHPYVADVDIFGPYSLFQLLCRATTESGQALLAGWMAEPASKSIILKRQQAVQELARKLDWRQAFQAAGMPFINSKSSYDSLLDWNEESSKFLPEKRKHLAIGMLLGVVTVMAATFFAWHLIDVLRLRNSFSVVYMFPLLAALICNKFVLKKWKTVTEEIAEKLRHNVTTLKGYEALINEIESETFGPGLLSDLQMHFRGEGYSAAGEIRKLSRILDVFIQRSGKDPIGGNAFYAILNQIFLLDIYWVLLTEAWKSKNRENLRRWADAVSEFEAFSSLSGFAFSNPGFPFPSISDERNLVRFAGLGHPLIHVSKRVCNDFALAGDGSVVMITGSNMAGKSTFLRTIGVNLVLAFMGAPCCMRSGEVAPVRLFTSMRTQDNLEEGVSSFYAELRRIEQLLKLVESGAPVFFLLDEMFKGTNSQDRYKGGISLIRQLSEGHAFGLISTHDIELAKTAGNYLPVVNYSFNSRINDREMLFDYTLTEGLCRDFNASELMKKSGIKLL